MTVTLADKMDKYSSLVTQQEVGDLLWRRQIEVEMEKCMNLTLGEKIKKALDRIDEKLNVILKMMGIWKTFQEVMKE